MSVLSIAPLVQAPIEYPESDGQPMGETEIHVLLTLATFFALQMRYRNDPQVYVAGNMFLYYEKGNPRASLAPDGFVVFGVPKHERRTYQLWEEGKAPDVVFEFTSRSTDEDDMGRKRWLYERLGVKEYFLFDPLDEYLTPRLKGFRLAGRNYSALPDEPFGDGEWRMTSQVLNLELRTESARLRLFDPQTSEYLLWPNELYESQQRAVEARQAAEARAQHLESEVERLKAELARLRA